MPTIQTRRHFLTMTALAGAAGILPPRRGWAAEPALETTTVRLCVQRRLACSAGDKPAGVEVRAP
jgi:hypothetical protein